MTKLLPMDSSQRFSDRAAYYHRYRPHYPVQIVNYLERQFELTAGSEVADVGMGTGRAAELFVRAGHRVHGVEPSTEMRAFADGLLGGSPGYDSRNGTAENTGLPGGCVDLIVAAQVFHWLDLTRARVEFQRILRKDGGVAIVWNDRIAAADGFSLEYEALLRDCCPDYRESGHRSLDAGVMRRFLAADRTAVAEFDNVQALGLNELMGRALSSSYVPIAGPAHERVMDGLRELFGKYARDERVHIRYVTKVFSGALAADSGL